MSDQIRVVRTGRKMTNSGTEYEATFPDGSTDLIKTPKRGRWKNLTPEEEDARALKEAITVWANIQHIRKGKVG